MTRWSSIRGVRSVFWPRCFLGSPITCSLLSRTSCIYAATMAYMQLHHVREAPQGKSRSIASVPSRSTCVHGRSQLPRPCTSSYTYVNPGRAYKLLSKALSERHNKAKLGNWGCVRRAIWLAHDLQAQGKTRSAGSMSYASFHRTAPHSRKPWCLTTTW